MDQDLAQDVVVGTGVLVPGVPADASFSPAGGAGLFKGTDCLQEQGNWCWAACARMLLLQVQAGLPLQQCEIASLRCGGDCCVNKARCNQTCKCEEIKPLLKQLGLDCEVIDGSLQFEALRDELLEERPVQFGYFDAQNPAVIGHYVLATKTYITKDHRLKFTVANPLLGIKNFAYEELCTDRYGRVWSWTWFRVQRRG